MKKLLIFSIGLFIHIGFSAQNPISGGTLKASGRYFTNQKGEVVYLTGIHT